jgi:hypothetical protein
MGVDFLFTKRHVFKCKWDKGREDLSNPTLFSGKPVEQRTLSFAVSPDSSCRTGTEVVLRSTPDGLAAYSANNERVCVCPSPPAEILSAIKANCGVAVGKVMKVHGLSRTADISVQ